MAADAVEKVCRHVSGRWQRRPLALGAATLLALGVAGCGPRAGLGDTPAAASAALTVSSEPEPVPSPLPVPEPTMDPRYLKPTPRTTCGPLDGALVGLIDAPNAKAFAFERGIEYDDATGRARVMITLHPDAQEGDLAQRHSLLVRSRFRNSLNATVPVPLLCGLGNDPRVQLVRNPPRLSPG